MRRSARWVLAGLLAALAVLAGGCDEQSRVDPDEVITITGQVHAPGGHPASGQAVLMGTHISEGDGAFALLTRGVACTGRACGRNIREATTGADGRYTFTVRGRDTQSGWGEAAPVLVSAAGGPGESQVSGPMVWSRFRVQAATVELPALVLVEPGLTVEAGAGVTARWATHQPGPYELVFEQADAMPVWLVRTGEPAASVDPRVLEDTTGGVVVSGGSEEPILGGQAQLRWRSPAVAYTGGAGAPPSRGQPCRYVAADGAVVSAQDCGLTDGDLATAASRPPVCTNPDDATTCAGAATAVIDLAHPVAAELVVVRGCELRCSVEVSADGAAFAPAGEASGDFESVALDGQPIHSVRVGGLGSELREVSVWGHAPDTALAPVDDADRADLAERYSGGATPARSRRRALLVTVAVLALAANLVGLGFVLGRGPALTSPGLAGRGPQQAAPDAGPQDLWWRRTASLMALVNAGYLVFVVAFVAFVAGQFGRELGREEGLFLALLLLAMTETLPWLLVGVVIIGPLLTWLVVLAVGLWRGRPWARVGAIVTFTASAGALLLLSASGGAGWTGVLMSAVIFAGPSLLGLAVVTARGRAFRRHRAV